MLIDFKVILFELFLFFTAEKHGIFHIQGMITILSIVIVME